VVLVRKRNNRPDHSFSDHLRDHIWVGTAAGTEKPMMGQEDTLDLPAALSMLAALKTELDEVGQRIDARRSQYMRAGGELRERAGADAESIQQLREEAERLVRLIQGGSLGGMRLTLTCMPGRHGGGVRLRLWHSLWLLQ